MRRIGSKLRLSLLAWPMTILTLTRLGLAATVVPEVSFTLKTAAEFLQPGDSLPLFVIVENKSQSHLFDIQFIPMTDGLFTIGPLPPKTLAVSLAPNMSSLMGLRVRSAAETRPGKYTISGEFRYRLRDDQGKIKGPIRAAKDFVLEVKSPLQISISAPTVTVTVKALGDTIREKKELLPIHVFIENKSPVTLDMLGITALKPKFLAVKRVKAVPNTTIPPFGTLTDEWAAELSPTEALKYGKHAISFDIEYQWQYGDVRYRSHVVAPAIEVSVGFFGSDAVSQVFGVPLNLIVFVLPGFCFLFAYWALSTRLLNKGEPFTPTSKDGLFYSVLWSICIIFFYKLINRKDLYAFFTLNDLFFVNVGAVVAGSLVPMIRWRWKKRQEKSEGALRFDEDDDAFSVLRKALSRRSNPDQYEEVSVVEGNREWKGILLSLRDEPLVLGSQLSIRSTNDQTVKDLEAMKPSSHNEVSAFLKTLNFHVGSGEVTIEVVKPVTYRDNAGGQEKPYGKLIKISDPNLKVTPAGVIYLLA